MKLRRLSIGTFNLFNLNEPGLPIYTDENGWTQAEYNLKIDFTQRVIRTLKPDILVSRNCGTRLRSRGLWMPPVSAPSTT